MPLPLRPVAAVTPSRSMTSVTGSAAADTIPVPAVVTGASRTVLARRRVR